MSAVVRILPSPHGSGLAVFFDVEALTRALEERAKREKDAQSAPSTDRKSAA